MNSDTAAAIIRRAHKAEMSYEGIADRIGCSTRTVWGWLNNEGEPTKVHRLFAANLRALRAELTGATK